MDLGKKIIYDVVDELLNATRRIVWALSHHKHVPLCSPTNILSLHNIEVYRL